MKLDRNMNPDGQGKYALVNTRHAGKGMPGTPVNDCGPGEEHEFFVIMLKDRHALPALAAYAASICHVDNEFAEEVRELCNRAGKNSKFCREPD